MSKWDRASVFSGRETASIHRRRQASQYALFPRLRLQHRPARRREGAVVLQGGDFAAGFGDGVEIDRGADDADLLAAIGDDLAPGIDDQRMAPGLAALGMG